MINPIQFKLNNCLKYNDNNFFNFIHNFYQKKSRLHFLDYSDEDSYFEFVQINYELERLNLYIQKYSFFRLKHSKSNFWISFKNDELERAIVSPILTNESLLY